MSETESQQRTDLPFFEEVSMFGEVAKSNLIKDGNLRPDRVLPKNPEAIVMINDSYYRRVEPEDTPRSIMDLSEMYRNNPLDVGEGIAVTVFLKGQKPWGINYPYLRGEDGKTFVFEDRIILDQGMVGGDLGPKKW